MFLSPMVMFLSPIVAFWNLIPLNSSSMLFFFLSLIGHNSILIKSNFKTKTRSYIVWKYSLKTIAKFFIKKKKFLKKLSRQSKKNEKKNRSPHKTTSLRHYRLRSFHAPLRHLISTWNNGQKAFFFFFFMGKSYFFSKAIDRIVCQIWTSYT